MRVECADPERVVIRNRYALMRRLLRVKDCVTARLMVVHAMTVVAAEHAPVVHPADEMIDEREIGNSSPGHLPFATFLPAI